jgi:hypothetical protein
LTNKNIIKILISFKELIVHFCVFLISQTKLEPKMTKVTNTRPQRQEGGMGSCWVRWRGSSHAVGCKEVIKTYTFNNAKRYEMGFLLSTGAYLYSRIAYEFVFKTGLCFMHLFNHLAFYIHWWKVFVKNNSTKIITDVLRV